ncbi:hypothetical protein F4860DRAFT_488796 [Xylaria cubensis]|nr:hypothetical protein F4860DRAFT_488796 [Xylaria cubensis]
MAAYEDPGNASIINDDETINSEPRPRSSHSLGQAPEVQPTHARSPNTAYYSYPTSHFSQSQQGLGAANFGTSPRQGQNRGAHNEQSKQTPATTGTASTMAPSRDQSKQQLLVQLQETRNELRKERESHEQSKIALQEQKKETEEARQSQKKIGIELNNIKAQQQRRYQVTDNELANVARQLRYQISNIAHVHFKQEIQVTDKSTRDSWQLLNKKYLSFTLPMGLFSRAMSNSVSRPLVVNLVLWSIIAEGIMGKLNWAGVEASDGWTLLVEALNPVAADDATKDLDEVRKYQLWKADTANLIAERQGPDEEKARAGQERLRQGLAKKVYRPLRVFTGSKTANLEDDIIQIIDKALELDQMISRQVAEVSWETGIQINHYDPQSMEPHGGGELLKGPYDHLVAIAPGMMKRGTSTGANFEVNNRLLRTEVASIRLPALRDDRTYKPSYWRHIFVGPSG